MFKTTVKYTDFLGAEREETLRFNLNEQELLDLTTDDLAFNPAYLGAISKEQDAQSMFKVMRKLILLAYGEMSEDGRFFRKSEQITSDFAHSAAYEALLNKLLTGDDVKFIESFMLGIFPAKISEQIRQQGGLKEITEKAESK